MSDTKPTYEELLKKLTKLESENKKLRLRPSLHSSDANILDFLRIKGDLAQATLVAKSIKNAMEISLKYLLRIDNIHSLAFFIKDISQNTIKPIVHKNLPKRLITDMVNNQFLLENQSLLFPSENKIYFSEQLNSKKCKIKPSFLKHLNSYSTLITLPLLNNTDNSFSIILLSRKEFTANKYIKVLFESIQAQLSSSFHRIKITDKLKQQTLNLADNITERTTSFEKMNKELIQQVKTHRQKEQNFSEKLELFKSIIQQQKDLVLRINKEGDILYKNPQFDEIHILEEGLKENLFHYFGEGDFPGLPQIILDFENGAQSVDCEIQLLKTELEWFNFYFSPIRNRRGILTEIQIVARNINELKKLEYKLIAQKEMLFSMLATTEKVSFTINNNSIIELISTNIEQYTQKSPTEIINQPYENYIHPDDIKPTKEKIRQLSSDKRTSCSFKFRLRYPDKKWYWQDLKISTVKNSKNKILYFVGSFFEIKNQFIE